MPLQALRDRGITPVGLWYNPNVHPKEEYALRMGALRDLASRWALDVRYVDHYGEAEFLSAVSSHEGLRCEACYRMRLDETARTAAAEGIGAFSTSLLVSPYQKHDLIAGIGREAAARHGVEFYYEDWRPQYREGAALSRELGLYRQRHCGCILSYEERGLGSRTVAV